MALEFDVEPVTEDGVQALDQVSLELSPYDLTKGRITYRHK